MAVYVRIPIQALSRMTRLDRKRFLSLLPKQPATVFSVGGQDAILALQSGDAKKLARIAGPGNVFEGPDPPQEFMPFKDFSRRLFEGFPPFGTEVAPAPRSSAEGVQTLRNRTYSQPRGAQREHAFTSLGPFKTAIVEGDETAAPVIDSGRWMEALGGHYHHTHPDAGPITPYLSPQDLSSINPRPIPGLGPKPKVSAYSPSGQMTAKVGSRGRFIDRRLLLQELEMALSAPNLTGPQRHAVYLGALRALSRHGVYNIDEVLGGSEQAFADHFPQAQALGQDLVDLLVANARIDPKAIRDVVVKAAGAAGLLGGSLAGAQLFGGDNAEAP